jgi:hypothetical protein
LGAVAVAEKNPAEPAVDVDRADGEGLGLAGGDGEIGQVVEVPVLGDVGPGPGVGFVDVD